MTRIVAVDPGFDATGLAIFDVDAYDNRDDARSLGAALLSVRTIRTSADMPLVERVRAIGDSVRVAALEAPLWRLYLEQPAKPGSYNRNREIGAERMAGPMSKLYLTVGAIIDAGAGVGAEVLVIPAPRLPKEQRQVLAKAIFVASPAARAHRSALPSLDALDAIWLGAQQLAGDIAFDRRRNEGARFQITPLVRSALEGDVDA